MKNYLAHLQSVGDSEISFKRKLGYISYNFGRFVQTKNIPTSVLEIGPGTGAVVSYLNSYKVENIDLIDNDANVLKYVKSNFKIHKFFKSIDISMIGHKLQKYDLIFMLQVFEHIPRAQYKSVLKTLVSKLKTEGKIIIMVPNGGNPLNMLERYHDLQHETAFTEDSLRELANYCDIDNVSINIEAYCIPPNSIINLIRIILQKLLHLIIVGLIIINGGVYQKIMTPNITLILTKK